MPFSDNAQAANFVPDNILVGGAPTVSGVPQCELGYAFYNGLGCTVTIVTRTGVQLQIPPDHSARGIRGFVVRSTYRTDHGVIVNTHDLLNDEGLKTSKEAAALESVLFTDKVRIGRGIRPTAILDYVISKAEFDRNGGSVYLTNLDLTLSTLNVNYVPKHPYSLVGQRQALADGNMTLMEGRAFGYEIRIVDRDGRFGDRFVNIAGEVYQILASRDDELRDGVYLVSPTPANGESGFTQPRSVYYSFEEAEKSLFLYRNFTDAKTLGDPDSQRERELKDWGHRLKEDELRNKEERQRRELELDQSRREIEREREAARQRQLDAEERIRLHDTALREREANLAREEHAYKTRELELKRLNLELKEELDRRSATRKDTAEMVKYIPAIIAGIGAIFMAIKTISK